MPDYDLARLEEWMTAGTRLFTERVDELPESDFRQPSRLPGWTRAHVIAHVARNADALLNLVHWARTSVATPMYSSSADRDAAIEAMAQWSAEDITASLRDSSRRLAQAWADLPEAALDTPMRDGRGGPMTARAIPWARAREVWLHAVDLNTGWECGDLPEDLTDALLGDMVGYFTEHPDCPPLRLVATDRETYWTIKPAASAPTEITGPAADLLGWLSGRQLGQRLRTPVPEQPVPDVPAWL